MGDFLRYLLLVCMVIGIFVGFALVIASITVFPMMSNYKQCGSIFLCQAEPTP